MSSVWNDYYEYFIPWGNHHLCHLIAYFNKYLDIGTICIVKFDISYNWKDES